MAEVSDEKCPLSDDERAELAKGRVIACIGLIRKRTGLSLKDAKALMDRWRWRPKV